MQEDKNHPKAKLVLEDGTEFSGISFGHPYSTAGEVVFNTGMSGYPQALTDPSYCGQILTFTYPMIGNYGVSDRSMDENGIENHFESSKIHVEGVIVSEYSSDHNHWNAKDSFEGWLRAQKIPAICDIDTRALTKKLRTSGVMLGKIIVDKDVSLYDPNKENLVAKVSRDSHKVLGKGKHHIVLVDCGMKNNIIRCFLKRDTKLTIVPWNYDFNKMEYDGLFISNGPGDPTMCKETIANIRRAMENKKPIFGICLGHQLLALSAGAKTYKLKFGHRSQNQPAVLSDGTGHITSQNHGFAVDAKSLPSGWIETFQNANDSSNEGIKHAKDPFFSVQFHPEGFCGPQDTEYLFDEFIEMIGKWK